MQKFGIFCLALGIVNCVYAVLHNGEVVAGTYERWWSGPVLILSSGAILLSQRRSRAEK